MIDINKYKFEPGARSIIQMGEELIGHPTTAINELVKNGYDADATTVKIYIHYNKSNKNSFIVISDSGLGMKNETLFGDWLKPSVSQKRDPNKKSDIFQRTFLGSKGIGRLASMALGRYLTVISKTSEEETYNWLLIDRADFREESLLSNIEFPGGKTLDYIDLFQNELILEKKKNLYNPDLTEYLKEDSLDSVKEGTIIIVEELDDSIRTIIEDEFLDGNILLEDMSLVRSLKILITPLSLNQSIQEELIQKKILDKKHEISLPESTFEIFYGSNLLKGNSIKDRFINIGEFSILSNYDYRILGKVSKDGNIEGVYYCNRLIEDSFEEKLNLSNKEIFQEENIKKRNIKEIEKTTVDYSKAGVGSFFFDLRIYDRDPESMDKLAKLLKTSGRRDTAYVLDSIVGLRISKNGFGVKPYGEEEKDWMELGEMRVQNPSAILGTNQIIGNIFLFSPENDGLNEKTNREGFFENEAFITFKKVLKTILIECGKRRFNYRQKHGIGRKISSKHQRPDTTRFLEFIKGITSDKNVVNEAESYISELGSTLDNLENSLTFSQRLATLGSGLELVYHELAQPISIIGKCLFALKFPIGKVNDLQLRQEFLDETSQIKEAIHTLDLLKESLEPAIGRSKRSDFNPLETFNKVTYLLTKDIVSYKIEIEIDPKFRQFTINDHEYNLWISFLNILNNAIYWLKTEEIENRKIYLSIGRNEEIIISNNGPKIDPTELENIFNYGVSHKKTKNISGLGLAFTRSLLTSNSWDIWAENFEYGPAFLLKKTT